MAKIEEIVLVVGQETDTNTSSSSTTYANKDLSNVADTDILEKLKSVDGENSGLDADLLDGNHAADFADKKLNNVADTDILNKIKNVDGENSGLDADKLDGYHLFATVNPDGSFNDDGIFKIKKVNGEKFLVGILDVNINTKTTNIISPIIFDIFGDGSRIALFEFEGNANDTGGMYNGTWKGTEAYDIGKIGQAAKFNGSSSITTNTPILPSSADFSVSFWFRKDKDNTTSYEALITQYDYNNNNSPADRFIIGFENKKLSIFTGNQYGWLYTSFTPTIRQTYHIAIVKTSSDIKVYVNGNLSNTFNNSITIAQVNFYIGGSVYHPTYSGIIGLMDHVSIFNSALTDEEIKILYNEGM